MRPAHLFRWCLVLMAATLATSAATASADDYLSAPGQIQPAPETSAGKGPQPNAASFNARFQCVSPQVTVANKPSGYAIGNCAAGTYMHVQKISDAVSDSGKNYLGGMVYGDLAACSWVAYDSELAYINTQAYNDCNYNNLGIDDGTFWSYTDGCSGQSSCAGTPLNNPGLCYEYANARPWLNNQTPTGLFTDPAHIVAPNATILVNGLPQPRLAFRYVTKYILGGGWNQKFALVRDRANDPGQGNWVFVPAACMGLS